SILSPQWKIHGSHMVTRLPLASSFRCFYKDKLDSDSKKIRVAAFDMDDTLICTKSGIKFGRGPYDWKWRNDQILPALQKKVKDKNMVLVIFTNQSAVSVTELLAPHSKSYKNLSLKVGLISKALETGIGPTPVLFFASTGRPRQGVLARSSLETHFSHKKPELGMWSELERYIRRCFGEEYSVDLDLSYFVGDAAGRDGDHLAADKGFAENAGVPFFVPEDYF
ncbi:PNK3P-domain-containing protein, partial [Metschnikowia bicuspidata var. bicuspidata NRRL YB-4993]